MLNEKIAAKYWNAWFYHQGGGFKYRGVVLHNNEYKPVLCGDWSGGTNPSDMDSRCEWVDVKISVKPFREISIEDIREIFGDYIKEYFDIKHNIVDITCSDEEDGVYFILDYEDAHFNICIKENDFFIDYVTNINSKDIYDALRDKGYDMDFLIKNNIGIWK